jgi:hypothetical protein
MKGCINQRKKINSICIDSKNPYLLFILKYGRIQSTGLEIDLEIMQICGKRMSGFNIMNRC